jgi:putative SOS response-associated peptidase YedK
MCGRYASAKNANALIEEFDVDESKVESELPPDYNVAPTKQVYAVLDRRTDEATDTPDDGTGDDAAPTEAQRQLRVVKWGLVPSWAKDPSIGSRMINARSETLAEKPAFRRAFAKRRCLMPADGYFEWYTPTSESTEKTAKGKPKKQPFFIRRADGQSLAMAGLYEWWHDDSRERDDPSAWLLSATIITTDATDSVGRIHDRMPVVIARDDWPRWLDPEFGERSAIETMMRPALATALDAYPVSVRVNSVRNNGPELIDPLPLDEAIAGSVGDDGLWPPPTAS